MTTQELATRIYNNVNKLNRSGAGWDEWDDKREIEHIKNLIENYYTRHRRDNKPVNADPGAGFQGGGSTDGMSGFRG